LAPAAVAGRRRRDRRRARDQRVLGLEVLRLLGVALVEQRLAALEEPVARRAEPLPQLVALLAREMTALLPLRLQPLQLLRGRCPIRGLGEQLGLGDQRLLHLRDVAEL